MRPHSTRGRRKADYRVLCGLLVVLSLLADVRPGAAQSLQRPAASSYDVVALRVAFQPDTTRFTTGDGTFEGALYDEGLEPSIDPLPHDAAYFEAHLDFLRDYVEQTSGGATRLTTRLLPGVVQLSQPMAAYSPTGPDAESDDEQAKLAALVEEAWRLADETIDVDLSSLDSERTAFVIFHAGVGRDIELVGTTLDKTPQDLPSLFFGEEALDRLVGRPITFKGMPVEHTIVLPRTETRQGFDFIADEPFLIELSINGLMAASFFNFLGVPDLFDTVTGESAIGPFGLMDPLGLFAYRGLFPPYPSAWIRSFLGWADPLRPDIGATVTLQSAPQASSVAHIPVSDAEYFLVENRNRDPEGDGLVMQVWQGGQIVEQRVQNGDSLFNSATVEGFVGGVVVGVDHYDWALPGGLDEDGNDLNGGLLIWHIDERRLRAGMATNRVNADPLRRAIDLEEADSGQDLGFPSDNPFGFDLAQGSPFDFFYEGNPVLAITEFGDEVQLYQNRFGPDTFPNSDSNEGGPSFVVLDGFSQPGPEMTFTYREAETESGIAPLLTSGLGYTTSPAVPVLKPTGGETAGGLILTGASAIVLLDSLGNLRFFGAVGRTSPAAVRPDGIAAQLSRTAPGGGGLRLSNASEPFQHFTFALPDGVEIDNETRLVYDSEGEQFFGLVSGSERAVVGRFERNGMTASELFETVDTGDLRGKAVSMALAEGSLALSTSEETVLLGTDTRWTYGLAETDSLGQAAFGSDMGGLLGVLPVVGDGTLRWLLPDGTVEAVNVADRAQTSGMLSAYPVLADLDSDARLDVLVTYGEELWAFTQGGAAVAGFPIQLPATSVAQPLVAELTESGGWSVLIAATNGYLYAYDVGQRGEPVAGFPLAVGESVEATPLLYDGRLYAVAKDGPLKAWRLENLGEVWWGQLYADAQNTSYVELDAEGAPPPAQGGALLVASETYNHPNPITDGRTFLRCQTSRDARIRITIIDLAGRLIDEMEIPNVRAGVPSEHAWQTSAPSGLYFARIQATDETGTTETRLVKMAIVR